jgi:hypothetical protein
MLGRVANLLARTPFLSQLIAKIFSYRSRYFGHSPSFRSQTPSTGEFCNKNLVNFAKTGEFGDKPLSHNLPQVIDLS